MVVIAAVVPVAVVVAVVGSTSNQLASILLPASATYLKAEATGYLRTAIAVVTPTVGTSTPSTGAALLVCSTKYPVLLRTVLYKLCDMPAMLTTNRFRCCIRSNSVPAHLLALNIGQLLLRRAPRHVPDAVPGKNFSIERHTPATRSRFR